MSIEGFRSLNEDIQTIITKTDHIKKTKNEKSDSADGLSKKEKKELSEEEKEIKGKRKMIQEKLIKFATRIPIFMYLTAQPSQCHYAVGVRSLLEGDGIDQEGFRTLGEPRCVQ